MQARSKLSWGSLKVEDGVSTAVAAEFEEESSAAVSTKVVCKTEEDEGDLYEDQLGPVQELFHLLCCRDVEQARNREQRAGKFR